MIESQIRKVETPSEERFELGSSERPPTEYEAPVHDLDSEENQELHLKLLGWRTFETQLQLANRVEMATDEDYYDHRQYTREELAVLDARGQAPALQNEVKPIIDWLIGTERRMRVEERVLPREESDRKPATAKTSIMKYLSDQNQQPGEQSLAFGESVKAGLSWLYCGARGENEEIGEPVVIGYESWRNVFYDSFSRKRNYDDARYWFRHRFVDRDVAESFFKDRKDKLCNEAARDTFTPAAELNVGDGWYLGERLSAMRGTSEVDSSFGMSRNRGLIADQHRDRVMLIEAWWKEPTEVDIILTPGPMYGLRVQEEDGPLKWMIQNAGLKTKRITQMVPHVAIMTEAGLLAKQVSPYRHNRFPAVPVWCYRSASDAQPYGVIRGLRTLQDLINMRRAKSHFLLSSNQLIIDAGTREEDVETMREQVSKPNGVIEVPPLAKRFEIRRDANLVPQLEQAAQADKSYMREVSGVTTENMGGPSNAISGVAVANRAAQGQVVSAEVFDNYSMALQTLGEIKLAVAEQFVTEEKSIRVLNSKGAPEFTIINSTDEAGNPLNPITESRHDFKIVIQDFRETARQAASADLIELFKQLAPVAPELVAGCVDLLVESSDAPQAEEIAKRLRAMTGAKRDDEEMTPEEKQQAEAKQEQQKKESAFADRAREADVSLKEAQAQKTVMEASAIESKQLKTAVEAIYTALQSAGLIAANPVTGPVAAELMQGADAPQGMAAPTVPVAPEGAPPIQPVDVQQLQYPT